MSFANCLHVDGANTHYKDGDEGSNEGSPNEWWLSRAKQTHTHNRLTAFVRVNPGRPVPEETLTHSLPTWSSDILSSSSIYNDQWHPLWVLYFSKWMIVLAAVKHVKWTQRSFYVLDSPLVQPLSRSSCFPLGLALSTSYSIHFFT